MRNQENGQSWISLASDVNYENLANHGFTQLDGVTIGGNSPVSISMLSGPSGDFMQATGYQISGPYSQQVVTANFGQVRTSVPPLDDNDLISSAGGEIILASAELSN